MQKVLKTFGEFDRLQNTEKNFVTRTKCDVKSKEINIFVLFAISSLSAASQTGKGEGI